MVQQLVDVVALTQDVIDRFQNYYGSAIRNNSKSLLLMQNAIWAIFYHVIKGGKESLTQQHRYCPTGSGSWCRYQQDKTNGTKTYSQSNCLPSVFRDELKPLFTRLSKTELLQRCLKGITQNQNEALNATLWSKCPKRVFCGRSKLVSGAALSVIQWNSGAAGIGNILTALGVSTVGINTNMGFRRENIQRLSSAAVKCKSNFRKRRQVLRQTRKIKIIEQPAYLSGAFSVHTIPDKIVKKSPETHSVIKITFVDEKNH